MSYSTRSRGSSNNPNIAKKYNSPGTFVKSEPLQASLMSQQQQQQQSFTSIQQSWPHPQPEIPSPMAQSSALTAVQITDMDMSDDKNSDSKKWLKKSGYKLSMKEKRRRQNKTLRRLITPKNALMVLNELSAGAQQECTVIPEAEGYGSNQVNRQYVAILNMGGVEYSGKGSTKLMAKNQAAESVIRDVIIKQMSRLPSLDSQNGNENEATMLTEDVADEQSFPMIQLASYALHKLFTEWQTEGYKVPLFGQPNAENAAANPAGGGARPQAPQKPRKAPTLPANPDTLHPCTLLSQMRGTLEYLLLNQEGTPPNGQLFTMGVTIDGKTYAGKANNKKEARKFAAAEACKDLYGVHYNLDTSAMH